MLPNVHACSPFCIEPVLENISTCKTKIEDSSLQRNRRKIEYFLAYAFFTIQLPLLFKKRGAYGPYHMWFGVFP